MEAESVNLQAGWLAGPSTRAHVSLPAGVVGESQGSLQVGCQLFICAGGERLLFPTLLSGLPPALLKPAMGDPHVAREGEGVQSLMGKTVSDSESYL